MKTNEEIIACRKIIVICAGDDGGRGYMTDLDKKKPNKRASVVWSFGGGWDHVSVSFADRCPTWDEMCRVKDVFFSEDECCVEYHPAKSEYVNQHPYCLHIWRPQAGGMPTPPSWMVGARNGENVLDVIRKAEEALREEERK